jgi:general secretion pathway protein N
VASAVLLVAALAWPWAVPLSETAISKPAPATAIHTVASNLPPLAEFSATRQRPLFTATRRPTPDVDPAAAAGLILGHYRLHGVVTASSRRFVLLTPEGSGELLRLGEGNKLDHWTIESIAPDSMTLRDGDRRAVVSLGKTMP